MTVMNYCGWLWKGRGDDTVNKNVSILKISRFRGNIFDIKVSHTKSDSNVVRCILLYEIYLTLTDFG